MTDLNPSHPAFWIAILKLVWIDILLSGDNAVVIALACRSLPARQRRVGVIAGAGAAVVLRIAFASVITLLMDLPFLHAAGGVVLLWIAVKLIDGDADSSVDAEAGDTLWQAVRIIVVADAVMSLDNVIAIAGASHGSIPLIAFGLALSIPLVVAGSTLVMRMLDRFAILVWAGGALLGWIGGELIVSEPMLASLWPASHLFHVVVMPVLGASVVLVTALLGRRSSRATAAETSLPSE